MSHKERQRKSALELVQSGGITLVETSRRLDLSYRQTLRVYARQHENGYICRESDNDNREVAFAFPVNPPLLSWAEWENYLITGDKDRLRAVFPPLVRHYEWWMKYQRRENGLYWTSGLNEADNSPRNGVMHSAVSATSYQGLAAQCLAKIAGELGREDMKGFFEGQNEELKQLVNRFFWDEQHQIYNDLDKDGRSIACSSWVNFNHPRSGSDPLLDALRAGLNA